jgi:hypothetical protein
MGRVVSVFSAKRLQRSDHLQVVIHNMETRATLRNRVFRQSPVRLV